MEGQGTGGLPHLVVHQAETGLTYLLAPEACTRSAGPPRAAPC